MGTGKSKLLRNICSHYSSTEVFLDKNILPIYITFDDFNKNYKNNRCCGCSR